MPSPAPKAEAFYTYVARRRQLFRVTPSKGGGGGPGDALVENAPGAGAFLSWKRALLQLLAERRPHGLELGQLQRTLRPSEGWALWLRKEVRCGVVRGAV